VSARWKTAFCVKCAKDQPYRVVREAGLGGYRCRWRTRKVKRCVACGEVVQPKLDGPHKATPTRTADGKLRASRTEARREDELAALARAGAITDFQAQVPFVLVVYGTPSVERLLAAAEAKDPNGYDLRQAATEVRRARMKLCTYIADAVYTGPGGRRVIEDTKGVNRRTGQARTTPIYRLKRKIFEAATGEEITEWTPPRTRTRRVGRQR